MHHIDGSHVGVSAVRVRTVSARTANGLAILLGNALMLPYVTIVVSQGILPQSVPQNLFVGIAENQAIWLETVQMKESATPVERQDIVLETALLLHFLLVT